MTTFLLAAALLAASPGHSRAVEGVLLPETIEVDGARLHLNGAGVRRATLFNVKVYVGALYLAQPSGDPAAVLAPGTPKAVRMRFLRSVDRGKVLHAFEEGFERSGAPEAERRAWVAEVASVIPGAMAERSWLSVAYLPGTGTTIVGPEGKVTIPGDAFARAMFGVWLGPRPVDDDLEKAMLGAP